jgi:hypothetical protein
VLHLHERKRLAFLHFAVQTHLPQALHRPLDQHKPNLPDMPRGG